MTIRSMTGFARTGGAALDLGWAVEVKSVNGRGLELRCRLPSLFDGFEAAIRDVVSRHVARGNVNVTVTLANNALSQHVSVNEALLERYAALTASLAAKHDLARASTAELLALPGVTSQAAISLSDDEMKQVEAALIASVETVCAAFDDSRQGEGAQLAGVLEKLLADIAAQVDAAEAAAAGQPQALHQRLTERLAALDQAVNSVDPDRLAQEIALLATKADVREELDRLRAHLTAARDLMARTEPVGRPFEFLVQEFMREANTLCSKSVDVALTRIGLDLKSLIEQVREQIKNIE